MSSPESFTLVKNAIHNPNEPRHFMRVVPASGLCSASVGETLIAQSANAWIVKEVGYDLYDHVVYFPRSDVNMELLVAVDKTTHCPLKGNTKYFDLVLEVGRLEQAAWSYVETIDVADQLRELIAFDTTKVDVS